MTTILKKELSGLKKLKKTSCKDKEGKKLIKKLKKFNKKTAHMKVTVKE